jgi:Mn2+/Fe2+ NRAMP family transporter
MGEFANSRWVTGVAVVAGVVVLALNVVLLAGLIGFDLLPGT